MTGAAPPTQRPSRGARWGLAQALGSMLGPRTSVAAGPLDALQEPLHPTEARAVRDAVPLRRREFTAGRTAARRALAGLGLPGVGIAVRADRSPAWPAGVVGSVTHTRGWCAAAVARTRDVRAMGVDAEPAEPLPAEVRHLVLTAREADALLGAEAVPTEVLERLAFSVKECVHKALQPLTGRSAGFLEVEVRLDPCTGRWAARTEAREWRRAVPGGLLRGRFCRHGPLWLTTLVLRAPR